jgi:uncharacterized protein (DUF488 family)
MIMNIHPVRVYTVGHSNRTLDELIRILKTNDIKMLLDIRSYPFSRRHPQFAKESLREAVIEQDIQYHWAGRQLGGMRKVTNAGVHSALPTAGLQGFAEYMKSEAFSKAVTQLVGLAAKGNTVMLCAEKVPEQCHRSLISDYLDINSVKVIHLIDESTREEHRLNQGARRESNSLIYDRNVTTNLQFH